MGSYDDEPKGLILNHFSERTINHWGVMVDLCKFDQREGFALRAFLGDLRRLAQTRDTLDAWRSKFDTSEAGYQAPDEDQRVELFNRTRNFFSAFYGALSHLGSVPKRFGSVFGPRNLSKNSAVIRWAGSEFPNIPRGVVAELEEARQFRTVLDHPVSFQPYDWGTIVTDVRPITLLALFGAGNPPEGAAGYPLPDHLGTEWHFLAPDEVSVTNCVGITAAAVLGRVLTTRAPTSAFVRPEDMHRHTVKAMGAWHPDFEPLGIWEEIPYPERWRYRDFPSPPKGD
ncbi:hypothetical protein P2A57_22925 [Xanthomonas perforans]